MRYSVLYLIKLLTSFRGEMMMRGLGSLTCGGNNGTSSGGLGGRVEASKKNREAHAAHRARQRYVQIWTRVSMWRTGKRPVPGTVTAYLRLVLGD
jgi:hypothetical protein